MKHWITAITIAISFVLFFYAAQEGDVSECLAWAGYIIWYFIANRNTTTNVHLTTNIVNTADDKTDFSAENNSKGVSYNFDQDR